MFFIVVYVGMKVILWDRYKYFVIFVIVIVCMIYVFFYFECFLNVLFRLRKIILIFIW